MVKKIAMVVKAADQAMRTFRELERWLGDRGIEVEVHGNVYETEEWSNGCSGFSTDIDVVVVLGGDGTLLSAARHIALRRIPILGVNLGRMGFITEIGVEGLYPMMESVLAGDYVCEERMMLRGSVRRGGEEVFSCRVLNDVVINKGALARIVEILVRVNGEFLNVFRADGLIVCSPTGSTAYNLAAGGPILHPTMRSIVLTPICPFMLSNRPIILSAESVVEIEIGPRAADVTLTYDGQVGFSLSPGDIVRVGSEECGICLIKSPGTNYFEILRDKLKWGER